MLTVYRPPKEEATEDANKGKKLILPGGRPYLTKVNGRLVMARGKRDKPVTTEMDLLGEAFGLTTTRVVRPRAKSADRKDSPPRLLTFPSQQQQQLTYPPSYSSSHALSCAVQTTPVLAYPPCAMQLAQFQPQFQPSPLPAAQLLAPPAVPAPPQAAAPPRSPEPRSATEEELALLKRIDADYNSYAAEQKQLRRRLSATDYDTNPKTTITVTKHVCANCGRLRSRKFHHENPIKPGEEQVAAFCKKCQRDASSTSDGLSSRSEKPKRSKRKKNKKINKSPSAEELPDSPKSKLKAKDIRHRTVRIKQVERRPSADYIVVEEFSDGETRRGRSPRPRYLDESDVGKRNLSPLTSQHPRPSSRYPLSETLDIPALILQRHKHVDPGPPPHHNYPSSRYGYNPAPPAPKQSDHIERNPSRQAASAPIQGDDRDILQPYREPHDIFRPLPEGRQYREHETYEAPPQQRLQRRDDSFKARETQGYEIYEAFSPRRLPRDDSFEEQETMTSARSQDSSRRRRLERLRPPFPTPAFRPWEEPHHIQPKSKDEVVVVTERFTYRPRKLSEVQEEYTNRDYIDKINLDDRQRIGYFEAGEKVSNYYKDNWSRDGPEPEPEPRRERRRRVPQMEMGRLSRDHSNANYIRRAEHPPQDLLRAPTHPSVYYAEPRTAQLSYPLSSDDSATERLINARRRLTKLTEENPRGRERSRSISDDSEVKRKSKLRRKLIKSVKEKARGRECSTSILEEATTEEVHKPRWRLDKDVIEVRKERRRSVSNHRPPYVRETTDGGTEQALIPSPRRSRVEGSNSFDDAFSDYAESVESVESRHVQFLSPPVAASASSEISSLVRRGRSPSLHESDIIEVIEERSPPRKSKTKETSGEWGHEKLAAGDGAWDTTAGSQW